MYELNQLFWYKPMFMLELILAESFFIFKLKKKDKFALRFFFGLLICFGVSFGFPVLVYNAIYNSFIFLSLFAASILAMKLCFDESWLTLIFCGLAGYTAQHIAYQLYDLFIIIFNVNEGLPLNNYGEIEVSYTVNPFILIVQAFIYGLTYWLIYIIFGKRIHSNESVRMKNVFLLIIVGMVVMIDIVFSSLVTFFSYEDFNKKYVIMLYFYNIICCLLALFIQFEIPRRTLLERDLATSNHIRYQERKQYNLTKENIQYIDLKCHDLKYQIRQIGDNSSINKETIKEIEDVISIYDSVVKTNNETLDVILTEKSLLCSNSRIKLSCIVAGEKLSFMNDSDLYSLFGNLIDNAIEAVRDLEEDKRTIGLLVKAAHSFLSINIHNYYDKVLEFQNNLPRTTKEDNYYHGFGMKSVQYICRKYKGEMTINTDNGVFNINIVFPI